MTTNKVKFYFLKNLYAYFDPISRVAEEGLTLNF